MADSYPDRPVRLVVPYQAGGGPDAMARAVAAQLDRFREIARLTGIKLE